MTGDTKVVLHRTRTAGSCPSKNQGCPYSRNNSVWCYGLCTPVEGVGRCGRIAHHALRGRTQEAIALQQEREGSAFDPFELGAPELWCRSGAW